MTQASNIIKWVLKCLILPTKVDHACLQTFILIVSPVFWNIRGFLGPYHISQVTFLLLTLQPALS